MTREDWQPIETAPRDGTVIIIWPPTFTGVVSCAKWVDRQWPYWHRLDTLSVMDSRSKPPTHWRTVLAGPITTQEET